MELRYDWLYTNGRSVFEKFSGVHLELNSPKSNNTPNASGLFKLRTLEVLIVVSSGAKNQLSIRSCSSVMSPWSRQFITVAGKRGVDPEYRKSLITQYCSSRFDSNLQDIFKVWIAISVPKIIVMWDLGAEILWSYRVIQENSRILFGVLP